MNEHGVATELLELLYTRGSPERTLRSYRRRRSWHLRHFPEEVAEARRLYWMCVYRDGGEVERFDPASIEATVNWLDQHSDPTAREVGGVLRQFLVVMTAGPSAFDSNVEVVLDDGGRISADWVRIDAVWKEGESVSGDLFMKEVSQTATEARGVRQRFFPRFTLVNVDLAQWHEPLNCTTIDARQHRDRLFVTFTIEPSRGVP
jgi:hypothetical protein